MHSTLGDCKFCFCYSCLFAIYLRRSERVSERNTKNSSIPSEQTEEVVSYFLAPT